MSINTQTKLKPRPFFLKAFAMALGVVVLATLIWFNWPEKDHIEPNDPAEIVITAPQVSENNNRQIDIQQKQDGEVFRDHLKDGSLGPEMVWIPAGRFRMGDIQGGGGGDEKPVHEVSVARFAMGRYEVTVGEFGRFVKATGYKTEGEKGIGCYVYKDHSWDYLEDANWRNPYFSQKKDHPVVCVSWNDAVAYAQWLSERTGQKYRLPTEAEWEYAARAKTETARYWGNDPDEACRYGNVHDKTSKKENDFSWTHHNCTDGYAKTAPVGHFESNNFGLFDMLGNVWEWTCSKYENKYQGEEKQCVGNKNSTSLGVIRGNAWHGSPRVVRAAYRPGNSHDHRSGSVGFRLVRF